MCLHIIFIKADTTTELLSDIPADVPSRSQHLNLVQLLSAPGRSQASLTRGNVFAEKWIILFFFSPLFSFCSMTGFEKAFVTEKHFI